MKVILTVILILFITTSKAQDIKKIINKNDYNALIKYVAKNEFIYPEIHFHTEDYEISALVYAARKERIEMVKYLIKNKDKIEDYNFNLSLAFAESVITKNEDLINYLYNLNPNINEVVPYYKDRSATMLCAYYGNEYWYFKLKDDAVLTLIDENRNNLLHIIANPKVFNKTIFDDILENKALDINKVNFYKRTPLQLAIRSGNYDVFKKILNKGGEHKNTEQVDLDQLFTDALFGGNIKIFEYVLKFSSKNYLWTEFGFSDYNENRNTYYPIELALKYNKTEIATKILNDMFNHVLQKDKTAEIDLFVNIMNSRTLYDDTFWPLHETISNINKEMYELLLRKIVAFNQSKIKITHISDYTNEEFTETAKIIFTKFEFRSAKRKFGKAYVDKLYNELQIKF